MAKSRPAIVMVSKFIVHSDAKFNSYVNYMDRSEAKRSEKFKEFNAFKFDGYHEYMENPYKSTGLFSKDFSVMGEEEKQLLKEKFTVAQKNKSPMWQTVFSFDNAWLEEQGLMDGKVHYLNEDPIKEAVTVAMNEQMRMMKMGDTANWTAAIHYNTDNVHVHVALIEEQPTRQKIMYGGVEQFKAKIPPKVIDKMKSKFSNSLINRDLELARISYLIRSELRLGTGKDGLNDIRVRKSLTKLLNTLPEDKRLWQYGNNAMNPFKNELNYVTDLILKSENPRALKELDSKLDDEMNFFKRLYGEGTKEFERFKDYKKNKFGEMYKDNGNKILTELKAIQRNGGIEKTMQANHAAKRKPRFSAKGFVSKKNVNAIKKAFGQTRQDYLGRLAYQRMQAEKEHAVQQQNTNQQTDRGYDYD